MRDGSYRVRVVRTFDAPRDLVFRNWVRAEDVSAWFVPEGFTVSGCELDARPGGRWWVEFRSAAGEAYREYGEFREVVESERLVFTLTRRDGAGNTGPETLVTVVFAAQGSKTEMTFEQAGFASATVRDSDAEGWQECFDKLAKHLSGNARPPGGPK
jgi:uncharacterized protein YndB with AHSA1/START domain